MKLQKCFCGWIVTGRGGSFNLNSQVEVNVVTMRVEVAGNDEAV